MPAEDEPERAVAPSDYYLLDNELTDDERAIRDRVRAFGAHDVLPVINDYWERAEFPFELVPKLAALNVAGTAIEVATVFRSRYAKLANSFISGASLSAASLI